MTDVEAYERAVSRRRALPGRQWVAMTLAGAMLLGLAGCAAKPDQATIDCVRRCEFQSLCDHARQQVADNADRSDRDYIRTRMRLFYARQVEGLTAVNDLTMEEIFDILSARGVNESRTVTSVVVNEDVKIWKGEPFEQAMGFYYIAAHNAMLGSWDNALAAAKNSLFHLRDYRTSEESDTLTPEQLVQKASEPDPNGGDYLDSDESYKVVPSPFALGHLLCGVASEQLARQWGDRNRLLDAREYYQRATKADANLAPVVEALRADRCNALLLVDFGQGPMKIGPGPDNAIASFRPITPSTDAPLVVRVEGRPADQYPQACDVNVMARDHRWNNLEDVRIAKSVVGTALAAGGTMYAAQSRSSEGAIGGLVVAAVGVYMKATAHADTRYCEVVPQRVYVVPLRLPPGGADVTLQISQGSSQSCLCMTGLKPLGEKDLLVRHVRLSEPVHQAPWMTDRKTYYVTDAGPATAPDRRCLPFILGGHCVRRPSRAVLAEYQRAGYLQDMTLAELEELYHEENIVFEHGPPATESQRHVLEGGKNLLLPEPGTVGFYRLIRQEHPPYRPMSERVQALAERCAAGAGALAGR